MKKCKYKELLEKYKFELFRPSLKYLANVIGLCSYRDIYRKETQREERVDLHVPSNGSKIEISWSASGINAYNHIDEPYAGGYAMPDNAAFEFLNVLKEACEIVAAYNQKEQKQ